MLWVTRVGAIRLVAQGFFSHGLTSRPFFICHGPTILAPQGFLPLFLLLHIISAFLPHSPPEFGGARPAELARSSGLFSSLGDSVEIRPLLTLVFLVFWFPFFFVSLFGFFSIQSHDFCFPSRVCPPSYEIYSIFHSRAALCVDEVCVSHLIAFFLAFFPIRRNCMHVSSIYFSAVFD